MSQLFRSSCTRLYTMSPHLQQMRTSWCQNGRPLTPVWSPVTSCPKMYSSMKRRREQFVETKEKLIEKKEAMKQKMQEIREDIFTYPNGLCVIRIALTPIIGHCVLQGHFTTGLILFSAAGITDLLDGYIARNFKGQSSTLGSVLDPVADKFLVATLFVTLTMADLISLPLTLLIIARDVIIMGCGLFIRYQSLPQPKTIVRYFDFRLASVEFKPTFISKVNTAFQLGLVTATLAAPVFGFVGHDYLFYLCCLTGATTLTSGLGYLTTNNTYKFIRRKIK